MTDAVLHEFYTIISQWELIHGLSDSAIDSSLHSTPKSEIQGLNLQGHVF